MRLVERYAAQLGLANATFLDTGPPADGRAFTVLEVPERDFPQRGVLYPTEYLEWTARYYLYDLVSAGNPRGEGSPSPSGARNRNQVE
jgi:hypothetical protein